MHTPTLQYWPGRQTKSHPPQLDSSVETSTQVFPHLEYGGLHCDPHTPPTQNVPSGQMVPQLPQLAGSLLRFLQAPPQQARPGGQAVPQPPQLAGSLLRFAQVSPHLEYGGLQTHPLHTPLAQVAVELAAGPGRRGAGVTATAAVIRIGISVNAGIVAQSRILPRASAHTRLAVPAWSANECTRRS